MFAKVARVTCDHGGMNDELTGLVLAGGRSRRMGTDKALLQIDGRPLVHRVAERLSVVCTTVLVASGPRPLHDLPWPHVDDHATGVGPLAGIVGGLAVATTRLVAVAAVDMPDLDAQVLRGLADSWDGEVAVVPVAAGHAQPLHAVYAVSGLPGLRAAVDAGARSVTRVLRDLDAVFVDVTGPAPWADNLNTPGDLARFQRVQ
jgi:molybdopterin-guanine dinucleotide biosynthesis protein A